MRSNALKLLFCGAIFVAPMAAHAEFSGSGELGLLLASGNSETETFNSALNLTWENGPWLNESTANFVYGRDDGNTNSNRFVATNRTNYSFSERSYLFGALRYDRDRFSAYNYQGTVSLGAGHRLIDNERHRLSLEAGPGFRLAERRVSNETENEAILRGLADYAWTISDSTELTNRLLVEAGSDNTFAENVLGLQVAINARLALKAGVSVRHNTDVDPGRKKTDTLTTVNLVYNFGE
jgi:putative salt-induced outer membrane protein